MTEPFVMDGDYIDLSPAMKALPVSEELFSLKYNKRKGDADGRKRERAREEILFLFHYYSWRSAYAGESRDKAKEEIKKLLKLPAKWEESETMKELAAHVVSYQEKNTQWRSLQVAYSVLNKLEKSMEETEDADLLFKYLEKIEKISENLKKQEDRFNATLTNEIAIGGQEVGDFESGKFDDI